MPEKSQEQALREAAQRFVDAYQGGKAQTLGNGAARRALEEFRVLLKDAPALREP